MKKIPNTKESNTRRSRRINVRVTCADITELRVDGFVYYARPDLNLGSGFGGMISRRGGGSIQQELREKAPASVGQVVITGAGKLNATFIAHAVGPAFQEHGTSVKLKQTVLNALASADQLGAKRIALPSMGTGFHGIPAELSATVIADAIEAFDGQRQSLEEIVICVGDPWLAPVYEGCITG